MQVQDIVETDECFSVLMGDQVPQEELSSKETLLMSLI